MRTPTPAELLAGAIDRGCSRVWSPCSHTECSGPGLKLGVRAHLRPCAAQVLPVRYANSGASRGGCCSEVDQKAAGWWFALNKKSMKSSFLFYPLSKIHHNIIEKILKFVVARIAIVNQGYCDYFAVKCKTLNTVSLSRLFDDEKRSTMQNFLNPPWEPMVFSVQTGPRLIATNPGSQTPASTAIRPKISVGSVTHTFFIFKLSIYSGNKMPNLFPQEITWDTLSTCLQLLITISRLEALPVFPPEIISTPTCAQCFSLR